MQSIKCLLVMSILLGLLGCSTISKFDVQADQDFYTGFKAMGEQKEISFALKEGCYDGWMGNKTTPIPTDKAPLIIKSLAELADLVNTAGINLQKAAIKEKVGAKWKVEDYNAGFVYCGGIRLTVQGGMQTAQDALPIILKIIAMFQ